MREPYPESGKVLRGGNDVSTQVKLIDLPESDNVHAFDVAVSGPMNSEQKRKFSTTVDRGKHSQMLRSQ